jgi:hypothetical protein
MPSSSPGECQGQDNNKFVQIELTSVESNQTDELENCSKDNEEVVKSRLVNDLKTRV